MKKSQRQILLDSIDAEIAELQKLRSRLVELSPAPKPKLARKAKRDVVQESSQPMMRG